MQVRRERGTGRGKDQVLSRLPMLSTLRKNCLYHMQTQSSLVDAGRSDTANVIDTH
jgi:hypothetical protein